MSLPLHWLLNYLDVVVYGELNFAFEVGIVFVNSLLVDAPLLIDYGYACLRCCSLCCTISWKL